MPFDGSGNYTPAAAPNFPAIGGATISSTYYNAVINDLATAMSNTLTRDGQGKPLADLNWNGKSLTNMNNLGALTGTFSSNLTVNGAITAGIASGVTLLMADNSAIRNTATGGNTMYFDSGVGGGSTTGDFNFRSTASLTSRMFINGSTGNVGIGTSSPQGKVEIRSVSAGTTVDALVLSNYATGINTAVALYFDPNGAGSLARTASIRSTQTTAGNYADLEFYTANSDTPAERMRITSVGNVGIGTSSPANLFEVRGAVTTTFSPNVYNVTLTGTSSATSGSSGTGISFRGFTTGSTTVSDLAFVSGIKENNTDGNYAGALVFGTRINGSGGGSFERMRIDSSGNVGIGTAAPGAKLDVVGSLRTSTSITTGGSISTGYGVSTGDCAFELGGERSGSGVSYIDLHATNSTDFEARLLRNSGANGTLDFINTGTGLINISQITANPIAFNTNGAERFRVGPVGQIGLGGANYGTSGQALISQGAGSAAVWGSPSAVASGATIDGVTIGYRSVPRSTTSGTATTGDVGKCIAVSAGITIPNATFTAGDALSIYNDSESAITITAGVTTLRQAGTANTGNRTLAARGLATVWFNSSTEAIISGAGVS